MNECMNECMYGERAVLAVGWRAEGLGLYWDWATTITIHGREFILFEN